MRRVLPALVTATVLTVAAVAPVAAAKPEHVRPGPQPPLDLPAELCGFPITLTSEVDTSKISIWEADDGTIRLLQRGYASGTATNTQDDIAFTHEGGFHSEVIIHPDGSVDVAASGNLFAWYFPDEPVVGLSTGLFAITGHGSESYGADESLIGAEFQGGHVVDLCAALAP